MLSSNRLYYRLKPYVPWRMRMGLRRIVARRQRRYCGDVWPINEAAGKAPEGWPGWPDGKKFAFVLTHDVEGPEGLAKCRQLMQLEQSLGFRSSFNFIPEGEYRVPSALREELTQNGFEVGVHDLRHDGKLYWGRKKFPENAQSINGYLKEWKAQGFRSGFMLHNLEWLHDLNIQYDASTFDTDPFEPQNDGVGTIFPFWVPRPVNGSHHGRNGYVELPYTLPQDSTLFLIFRERTPEIWLKKLDWVASCGGMAQINVHPDYLAFGKQDKMSRHFPVAFYETLLKYVKSKYGDTCWHALPKEIAAWYRNQYDHPHNVSAKKTICAPSGFERVTAKTALPNLKGKRAAVILYSDFPSDPRPWRATEALADSGMEVDVICLHERDSQSKKETIKGINVTRLPIRRKRDSKLNYFWLYSAFWAGCATILTARTLRKRYDLIHVHNMPDVLVFTGFASKLFGAKVILDLHDPMPELMMSIYGLRENSLFVRSLKKLEQWSVRFADLVLTPNLAFQQLFVFRKCPLEKIQIVMNSPQDELFNRERFAVATSPPLKPQFRLMYHGFPVKRHGLEMAVEAIASLHTLIPGITFYFYGTRTPYVEYIEARIEKLGLQKKAVYHGKKSLEEIAAAIMAADLGIIPNHRTPFTEINFPTRIFEYLALGKPVIVPRTRGICDYFDETQMLFFNPDDVDDLARVIQWVWQRPQETAEIVRRGREVYLRHLWTEEKTRFLALTERLLTGSTYKQLTS